VRSGFFYEQPGLPGAGQAAHVTQNKALERNVPTAALHVLLSCRSSNAIECKYQMESPPFAQYAMVLDYRQFEMLRDAERAR